MLLLLEYGGREVQTLLLKSLLALMVHLHSAFLSLFSLAVVLGAFRVHEDYTLHFQLREGQLLEIAPVQDVSFDEKGDILIRVHLLEESFVLHEVKKHTRVDTSVLVGDFPMGSV